MIGMPVGRFTRSTGMPGNLVDCQWSAVVVIVIGSAALAIGSADRKPMQSANLFRVSLLRRVFMDPAYEPGSPLAS
jgi:hypothetical protein